MIAGIVVGFVLPFLLVAAALVLVIALRGWRLPPPWNTELRTPSNGRLLVYDAISQPYMVTLPLSELRQYLGPREELKVGRASMWACRRDGQEITPLPLARDTRTNRTPPFLREYMRLRSVKNNLTRPPDKVQKAMMLGGSVAVVITVVAGLFMVTAVSG